jgi:hypothetical protein
MPVGRGNFIPTLYAKASPVKAQVKLESRFKGLRAIPAGRFLPLLHVISHIPIFGRCSKGSV